MVDDRYETAAYGDAPVVTAAASYDADRSQASVLLVNRSQDADAAVTVDVAGARTATEVQASTVADHDVQACNTKDAPDRVHPRHNASAHLDSGQLTIILPPVSFTAVHLDHLG